MKKNLDVAPPATAKVSTPVWAGREWDIEPTVIHYPESDGQPMGETDFHINAILYLRQALRYFFRQVERVYVAADMLFYYEEGNPAVFKVPDVFVVKGIARHDRRIYKLWEEQIAPCAVFEITSRSTRFEDLGAKRDLYERLGVHEYFLFDPLGEYLSPRLQGFQLIGGYFRPVELSAGGALFSQELGLTLRPEGNFLRLVDSHTGQVLPTLDEALDQLLATTERAQAEAERAQAEIERAQAEAERANAAEAELARLRLELERMRKSRAL